MANYMDDDDSSPSTSPSNPMENNEEKSDETEDQLALVPNHFFKQQPKPGMREMVEVVEVYENECSIKCVYGEDKEEENEEAEAVEEPEDAMMT